MTIAACCGRRVWHFVVSQSSGHTIFYQRGIGQGRPISIKLLKSLLTMTAIDPRFQQIRAKLHIYQEIARQDYDVPPRQALPVASRPDIAFRPSCYQLEPVWEPTQTAWVWEGEIIYKTSGGSLASDEIFADLAAAGVCVVGSNLQKVPLVPTDEVFAKLQSAIATPPLSASSGTLTVGTTQLTTEQWGLFVWAALPLLAIAGLVALLGGYSWPRR